IATAKAKRQAHLLSYLKKCTVVQNGRIISPHSSSFFAITSIEEPKDSLIMGDEPLSTISEIESDEFIKSSVENLVPIPSESEVAPDNESECDVPVNDESSPNFMTFSNPLFDCNDDFTSSDDKSLSNKDFPMKNFKIYSNPLLDEEFFGELAHINPIPPGIEETDFDLKDEIRLVENLLNDTSSPGMCLITHTIFH
ncbi:hypothetical protein Tco_0274935, partial [Tanacetum coccineum]